MVSDENASNTLMKLGLTEYEAKVLVALVKYGPKKAGEVSLLSKVPRPKTYGALRELVDKGLVEVIPERPERYLARSPNEKLSPLANRLLEEAQGIVDTIQSLTLTYESLKYVHKEKPPEKTMVWSVFGREGAGKMLTTIIEKAQESIDIVTSENGLVRYFKTHFAYLEQARSRGVKIRILTAASPESQKIVREMKGLAEIKKIGGLPPINYIAADSSEMLLVECHPDDYDTKSGRDVGAYSNNPQLVNMFKFFFNLQWGGSEK
ncbi:MAG: helix-turn-helix domain-containing protein [Candidatus Bathyarchaeia archaeon]